ncbi:hypothetical protein MKW98_000235, partial [Papaver atlanticum]
RVVVSGWKRNVEYVKVLHEQNHRCKILRDIVVHKRKKRIISPDERIQLMYEKGQKQRDIVPH